MGFTSKGLLKDIYKARSDYMGMHAFVESGTWKCQSILPMVGVFETLHTIELSRKLYEDAVKKCAGTGINLHHGDSAKILPELCKTIKGPAMFYLDAHWMVNHDEHIPDENPFPLWDELTAIGARGERDVVVVDDVHAFGRKIGVDGNPDLCPWRDLSHQALIDFIGADRIAHSFVHKAGDCVVLYLKKVQP